MSSKCNIRCFLNYFLFLVLLFCFVNVLLADEYTTPSFGFKKFDQKSKYLWSKISLFGDAKLVENGSFVQLTGSWNYSSGRVVYNHPVKLYEGVNPKRKASFGTYFVFSLSHENGDGLAFVLQNGVGSEIAVEFDTKLDPSFGDFNDNHVGINVGSHMSIKVRNLSDMKLKLNSGNKLQCWIDFEASSKRIEVRISKWGEKRPISPFISNPIDLSKMFKDNDIFIALASSNSNTTQVCKLYSWSFKLRQVPLWMHSQPLDPQGFKKDVEPIAMHKRSDCIVRVVSALIFGTGCGALGAFIALCAWSVFCTKNGKKGVAPEEYVVQPVVFDYDKVKVIVIDKSDGVKK